MLGDETSDADAVTLAGGEQVTGEAGIEPVQGDKNCDAVMEPKSGDAIHKADIPEQNLHRCRSTAGLEQSDR